MQEFLKVDLTIAVLVHFGHSCSQLVLRVHILELLSLEQGSNLILINGTTAVLVKHLEGCLQVVLPQEGLCIHGRSQELYNKRDKS